MFASRPLMVAATLTGLALAGITVAPQGAMAQGAPAKVDVRGIGAVEVDSIEVRVVSVDLPSRSLVVQKAGHQWRITVPEEAVGLAAVRPRDKLTINSVESALVSVAPPKSAKPDIQFEAATDVGLFNGLPGRWIVRRVIATVKYESLDDSKGTVSFVGPEGPRTVRVIDPAVAAALKKLKKGELVTLTFTQATEIVLTPRKF